MRITLGYRPKLGIELFSSYSGSPELAVGIIANFRVSPMDREMGIKGAARHCGIPDRDRQSPHVQLLRQTNGTVVIIAPNMRDGSVGAIAWRHAVAFSRQRAVRVVTSAIPTGHGEAIEAILVRPRTWNWLGRFCHMPNELSLLSATRHALDAVCRNDTVDAVWCHSHAAMAMIVAPWARRYGFKAVMTAHGDIFDRPPRTYSRDLTWFYRRVAPRAYRTAHAIQVLNSHMARSAIERGADPKTVHVIPHGVDPVEIGASAMSPRAPASFAPDGVLRLLYVGGLWRVKGPDTLLRAAVLLRDRLASFTPQSCPRAQGFHDLTVTLVGSGNFEPELRVLARDLGIGERVSFVGHVPRRDLAPHYARADIACVPSLSEALSLAAIEAMLCEVPVVGSDTGGIPALIEPGFNGYLATAGDHERLAAALADAAASREKLAELGSNGKRRSAAFRWPSIESQLTGLLDNATIQGRQKGHG